MWKLTALYSGFLAAATSVIVLASAHTAASPTPINGHLPEVTPLSMKMSFRSKWNKNILQIQWPVAIDLTEEQWIRVKVCFRSFIFLTRGQAAVYWLTLETAIHLTSVSIKKDIYIYIASSKDLFWGQWTKFMHAHYTRTWELMAWLYVLFVTYRK